MKTITIVSLTLNYYYVRKLNLIRFGAMLSPFGTTMWDIYQRIDKSLLSVEANRLYNSQKIYT